MCYYKNVDINYHITPQKKSGEKMSEEKNEINILSYQKLLKDAEYLKELRAFKHDFKNHIAGLKVLLDTGKYDEAREYLNSLEQMFFLIEKGEKSYSNNTLIDAILQNTAYRCKTEKIRFEAEVIVTENELPLSQIDICSLFGNICDNAFEAQSGKNFSDAFMSFTTSRREKWIIITAENRYDGITLKDTKGKITTSKDDKQNHGLGLDIIKRIVESVEGAKVLIEEDTEDKIFRISLVFPR